MSILNKDAVRVVAESIDIADLRDDVSSALLSDVEFRLREVIQESAKFMRRGKRTHMHSGDVNNALRVHGMEPTYGHQGLHTLPFQAVDENTGLYFLQEEEVCLSDVLNTPLPPCPREPVLVAHWLAVEGVQPAIRQNPSLDEAAHILQADGSSAAEPGRPGKRKRAGGEEEHVRPLVEQILSQELQLYYESVVACLQSNKNIPGVLRGLREDAGIQALAPYFSQFILENVTRNLQNLRYLGVLMKAARALLTNPHLHIEPYLHHLMPPILTCVLGKRICADRSENHWALRDDAAELVSIVCRQRGRNFAMLQSRVAHTLVHAFMDMKKPLTTHYGAIVALAGLGHNVTQLLIVPNARTYVSEVLDRKRKVSFVSLPEREEADRVYHALLAACGGFLRAAMLAPSVHRVAGGGSGAAAEAEGATSVSRAASNDYRAGLPQPTEAGDSSDMSAKGQEALRQLVPDSWVEYYSELKDIFGEDLSPFLPQSHRFSDPLLTTL
mmetsp:Transcript_29538/g.82548  ORF Transcript_29538/g.82548 Transcript_29538/m.82548 type:complete len:499 (-) Transcript_29538:15-1511(-)